ncbi:hypothetical protein KIPB_010359, partial [Kipferlia bialata]
DCCMVEAQNYAATYPRALDTARVAGANAASASLDAEASSTVHLPTGASAMFGYQLKMWDSIMVCIGNVRPTDTDMTVNVPLQDGRAMCVFQKNKLTAAIILGHARLEKRGMDLVQAVRKGMSSPEVLTMLHQ